METVDHIGDASAPRKSDDLAVTDDLAGLPVTDAELDVIEAFLMKEVRKLLSDDLKATKTPAVIEKTPFGPGARQ